MQWQTVLWIFFAAALFTVCDTLSTVWAKNSRWDIAFAVLVLSPLAYLFFGWTGARIGLANTSVLINAMIVVLTLLIGLVGMQEWKTTTPTQYVGLVLGVIAILLIGFGGASTKTPE